MVRDPHRAFFNAAVVVLVVSTFWASLDRRTSEVAATRAAPARNFREITLPLLAPSLAAAGSIALSSSRSRRSGSCRFWAARPIRRSRPRSTTRVRIFDLRAAAILSVVQLICVGVAVDHAKLEALRRRGRRRAWNGTCCGNAHLREGAAGAWACSCRARHGQLAVPSASPSPTAAASTRTAPSPAPPRHSSPHRGKRSGTRSCTQPLRRSSRSSSAVSPLLRSRTAGPRALDVLLMLPLGASAVMLGFGFVIAFDRAPIDFRAAPWIVPVVQALVAFFVVRIVAPTLRAIDQRQREAAAMLGASPGRVRREIDLPIVGRALAVAAGFAFAISLGEFGATAFWLARTPRRYPSRSFASSAWEINAAQAYALAVVLMVLTATSIFAVGRLRAGVAGSDAPCRRGHGPLRRERRARWSDARGLAQRGPAVLGARVRQEHAPAGDRRPPETRLGESAPRR